VRDAAFGVGMSQPRPVISAAVGMQIIALLSLAPELSTASRRATSMFAM
jgi:hypothetical protein